MRLIGIGLLIAALAGCQTGNGAYLENVNGVSNTTTPAQSRKNDVDKLQARKDDIDNRAPKLFARMRRTANGYSRRRIIINALGIASGLTSSVLLVASPANAVWAAGFTGTATGVLKVNTDFAREGFTRAAVARQYDRAVKEYKDGADMFEDGFSYLATHWSDSTAPAEWETHLESARKGLNRMEFALTRSFLEMGTAADIAAETEANRQLLAAIESLDHQIEVLNATVSGQNIAPRPDFTYSVNGTTVSFVDASKDADGTIASYLWNFGDQTTPANATEEKPNHDYGKKGSWNVTLTVTDDKGARVTSKSKTVTVQ